MIATPAIGSLIRQGHTFRIRNELDTGRNLGMFSMDQYLALLIQSGTVDLNVAFAKCQDPTALRQLLQATAPAPAPKAEEGEDDDEEEETEDEE